jgi:hypothetical protein
LLRCISLNLAQTDDNKHVYVPVLSADYIVQFKFNAGTGMLIPNDPPTVATNVPIVAVVSVMR